ncbi:MAG: trypsin-like peptidase domain-containing protein [Polyangiales bacterium]
MHRRLLGPAVCLVLLAVLAVSAVPAHAQELTEARRVGIAGRLEESVAVVQVGGSEGSGFVAGPDRLLVTNAHVVQGFERAEVIVTFRDRARRRARVLVYDPVRDLAILHVPGGIDARPLPLANDRAIRVGQTVLAFGNPFGLSGTLTQGIVSARRDVPDNGGGTIVGMIQTDAPINPGNSGGPLVNARGQVIGVNTMILSRSGGSVGIGFAVPTTYVRKLLDVARRRLHGESQDVAEEDAHPVWLGIVAEDFFAMGVAGVRIERVVPGGPAARAGLRGRDDDPPAFVRRLGIPWTGHIVIGVDGRPIHGFDDLGTALSGKRPGDRVVLDLTVGPGAVQSRVTLQLGRRPSDAR